MPTWQQEVGEVVVGGIIGVITYVRGRVDGKTRHFHSLHDCEKRCSELEDKISALETEFVAIRHLMPGGAWYERLRALLAEK